MNNTLASRIAALSPQELRQLVNRVKAKSGAHPLDTNFRSLRRAGERLPLSFAQERLWFVEQMGVVGSAYHMCTAVRVCGPLKEEVLERSVQELVRRHESLRTRFETVDGQGCQVIDSAEGFALHRVAVQEVESRVGESVLEGFARQESQRPFDLSRGPLFRVSLLPLAEQEYGLVLAMHHIISDGWSIGVMMRELGSLYESYSRGQSSRLSELSVQYADYALWQRQWLQGETLERHLQYWKEQLLGAPEMLELPADRVRPAVPSYRGGMHYFALPAQLSEALGHLARQEGATLFMVLVAAFQWVLSRWSGQEDVVVGTPVAGRTDRQTEGLIGFFVNTLPLRARLEGVESFRELLQQVKETALSAYAHQDLPFEKLVQELAPTRDLSRQPVFQAMLVLQTVGLEQLRLGSLQLTPITAQHLTAAFDLTLVLKESETGLKGALEYATDLFDESTVVRFAGHFQRVLEQVVAQPKERLDRLDMLSPSERHQVLVDWNATQTAYPQDRCAHELIGEQAGRTPDAIAVEYEGQSLTYRQLDERANQLAHYLRRLGVGPEKLVGLCLPRSLDLVVGLLGILKAGGAYLPLDWDYPPERLAFMLRDGGVSVLVSSTHRLGAGERSRVLSGVRVVRVDEDWPHIAQQPVSAPVTGLKPQQLAYCIYTSGSTGQPKGVMNIHRALMNRLDWMQRTYGLTGADRVLQKTPFTFDVSVWEFLWPLMYGARLVVARPEGHRDPVYLIEVIRQASISTLHFVPSMLESFLATAGVEGCSSIRRVICSGEALSASLRERFHGKVGGELHNLYGPTEAAIDVTHWACSREEHESYVPIGRPISNIRVYVLDGELNAVPIGVSGELYLGGVGLARGYLSRPGLTAQRFVADPFGCGQRLYRTGDVVRWRAQGMLEYLGRSDQQIKLRGFRIELGEVEAGLRSHPQVREAVVLAREVGRERQLVAYVVPSEGLSQVDEGQRRDRIAQYRQHLSGQLPGYMVPQIYILLEAPPLTANGKVDRRALPAPQDDDRQKAMYVAPRTQIEVLLCELWQEVLKLQRVGVEDNFFELGGDSIISIQVVSQARRRGLHLNVRQLFEQQTIALLARCLSSEAPALYGERTIQRRFSHVSQGGNSMPTLADTGASIPLTPVQRIFLALWGVEISLNASTYLYTINQEIQPKVVARAMEILVTRHDAFRLSVTEEAGRWKQRLSEPSSCTAELCKVIDLSTLDATSAAALMAREMDELRARVRLEAGGLIKAALFEFGSGRQQQLALHVHHFANDALSHPILIEELETLCLGLQRNETDLLPPVGTSFSSWAWTITQHLTSALAHEPAEQAASSMRIPVDFTRGENTVASARVLEDAVPDIPLRNLDRASKKAGLMIDDVLLVALSTAVQQWTGDCRVTIEQLRHGREPWYADCDVSRSIGWFTIGIPVSLDLSGTPDLPAVATQLHRQRNNVCFGGLADWAQAARRIENGASWERRAICLNHQGRRETRSRAGLLTRIKPPATGKAMQTGIALRPYAIELQTVFVDGALKCAWRYSANLHLEKTIQELAHRFRTALSAIAGTDSGCR